MYCNTPDNDGGTLGQTSACALQTRVDLPHFHCPLQPHHLKQLIRGVYDREGDTERKLPTERTEIVN